MWTVIAALLAGVIWGTTNPFIRKGSIKVEGYEQQGNGWCSWLQASLVAPWLLNQTGSVVFIMMLASADISKAVPVANAVSIATNAVTDVFLGERYHLQRLVPGCILVACGVILCSSCETAKID